jgi:hypothetical protein
MKSILYVFFLISIILLVSSCKKDNPIKSPVASLTVTNAIVGGGAVRVGSRTRQVVNNNYLQLTVMAGESDLYVWPIGDSSNPCFRNPKFYTEDRGIYSLFLTGQLPNATGVLVHDNLPYHTDSTCGIRIINLSPNSPPLNITLSTAPTVPVISNLTYLQYTEFKLFPAKAANTSYTFQIRNAIDNSLIKGGSFTGNFTFNTPRFVNITLVIRGMIGSSTIGVLRVNNER